MERDVKVKGEEKKKEKKVGQMRSFGGFGEEVHKLEKHR